jgi:hypothetical protein
MLNIYIITDTLNKDYADLYCLELIRSIPDKNHFDKFFNITILEMLESQLENESIFPDIVNYLKFNNYNLGEENDYFWILPVKIAIDKLDSFWSIIFELLSLKPGYLRLLPELKSERSIHFNESFFDNSNINQLFDVSSYIFKVDIFFVESKYLFDILINQKDIKSFTVKSNIAENNLLIDERLYKLIFDYYEGSAPYIREGVYLMKLVTSINSLNYFNKNNHILLSILKHSLFSVCSRLRLCLTNVNLTHNEVSDFSEFSTNLQLILKEYSFKNNNLLICIFELNAALKNLNEIEINNKFNLEGFVVFSPILSEMLDKMELTKINNLILKLQNASENLDI